MSIKIDISDTLVKQKLAQLPEKMLEWASEVLEAQAHLMVGYAQVTVNVDTGSLRDSIRVERGGEGLRWRQFRVRAGGYVTNPKTGRLVDYAGAVETRHPFMRPAFEMVKPEIANMLRRLLVEKTE